jgi:ABC-2 type transport system permease protein
VFHSIRVVLQKEWRELEAMYFNRSHWNPATFPVFLIIAAFSIYEPLRIGPNWTTSSIMLISVGLLLPFITVGSIIPYSFVGERERHTLEPLLATPISNIAILLGKIGVPTIYGWGMAILSMVASLMSINLAFGWGGMLFYPVNIVLGVIVMSLLISLFIASAGALASLHASTVMQAQQTLVTILFFPLLIPAFLIGPFSASTWKYTASQLLATLGTSNSFIILAAVLVILIVATMLVTLIRFHRENLLLG